MLVQQIIAIALILIIFSRIVFRYRKGDISRKEFFIWLVFWLAALIVVLFLRQIDAFVKSVGIVSRGIDIIVYVAVALIFYLIFRIMARLDKIESNITKVVRKVAIDEAEKKDR